MDSTDIGLAALAVGLVGYAAYKKSSATTTTTTTTTTGTTAVPVVAVSAASWAAIQADTNRKPWREIESDEWGSMCGSFGMGFPGSCGSPPTNAVNADVILSWFRGLNIDPVHNQGYAHIYKTDIQKYYNTANANHYNWTTVPVGSLSGASYISGISSRNPGLEGMACLG